MYLSLKSLPGVAVTSYFGGFVLCANELASEWVCHSCCGSLAGVCNICALHIIVVANNWFICWPVLRKKLTNCSLNDVTCSGIVKTMRLRWDRYNTPTSHCSALPLLLFMVRAFMCSSRVSHWVHAHALWCHVFFFTICFVGLLYSSVCVSVCIRLSGHQCVCPRLCLVIYKKLQVSGAILCRIT